MMNRVQELCRKLRPVLGKKIDQLWAVYLAESDPGRSPFPPPPKAFALAGDIKLGHITYGEQELYPFLLRKDRLKEHILVAGRSGSGKTNLTFVLMRGIMSSGIKVVALDWKRGYRDLLTLHPDLLVYTVGRDVTSSRTPTWAGKA